jgi:hypothetical protein
VDEESIEQQVVTSALKIQAEANKNGLRVTADGAVMAAGHVVGMNIALGELAVLKAEKAEKTKK